MRILVFGDSISFGAADPNGGWVQKLGKFLYGKTTKGNDDYQVYNLGISADSSIEILKRFESETIARERGPERTMIIFAFGTNDAQSFSNGSLRTSTEEFGSNVRKLIELARKYSSTVIFLGVLPVDEEKLNPMPWHPEVSVLSEHVSRNDAIIKEVCRENKIPFIDVHSKFLKLDYKSLLEDGLHPNAKGHKKVFSIVKGFLVRKKLV